MQWNICNKFTSWVVKNTRNMADWSQFIKNSFKITSCFIKHSITLSSSRLTRKNLKSCGKSRNSFPYIFKALSITVIITFLLLHGPSKWNTKRPTWQPTQKKTKRALNHPQDLTFDRHYYRKHKQNIFKIHSTERDTFPSIETWSGWRCSQKERPPLKQIQNSIIKILKQPISIPCGRKKTSHSTAHFSSLLFSALCSTRFTWIESKCHY